MPIEYLEGDLFSPGNFPGKGATVFVPHVCNDEYKWGAGFVLALSKHYPKARQEYLDWQHEFGLGQTQFVEVAQGVVVCNMVAQRGVGGRRPLRYPALVRCMEAVADQACKAPGAIIRGPLFGSDLAGGNWNFIEELIHDSWVDRGLPVFIHYLPGRLPGNWRLPEKGD